MGLEQVASNPQAVFKEIIAWTNGQPFLTQKLCQLVVKASSLEIAPGKEADWIECLVPSQIITNWESQDEPEDVVILWQLDRVLDSNQILYSGCMWIRDYLQKHPDLGDRQSLCQ
ncbi:serine/threonine kinase (plasmid) [Nostoc linckia NIES-25]|nr:serine/threonine kinase [Nostoc linckia NIES-25]